VSSEAHPAQGDLFNEAEVELDVAEEEEEEEACSKKTSFRFITRNCYS
jgi:hypothetical protein